MDKTDLMCWSESSLLTLTAPTGSVVLDVSAGERLLTRGQPIRLPFSLPNCLSLSASLFSPSVLFHVITCLKLCEANRLHDTQPTL